MNRRDAILGTAALVAGASRGRAEPPGSAAEASGDEGDAPVARATVAAPPPPSPQNDEPDEPEGTRASIAGRVDSLRVRATRSGEGCMAFFAIGGLDAVVFPAAYAACSKALADGAHVVCEGEVVQDEEGQLALVVARVAPDLGGGGRG